jgi:hypothetical protein
VLAECAEGESVCVAEVDLDYLHKVRLQMPIHKHRRTDLYGSLDLHTPGKKKYQNTHNYICKFIKDTFVLYCAI